MMVAAKWMETMTPKSKTERALKLIFAGLPLGAVVWTSSLPLAAWAQQALVLVTLLWFYAFFLLNCFYLGG